MSHPVDFNNRAVRALALIAILIWAKGLIPWEPARRHYESVGSGPCVYQIYRASAPIMALRRSGPTTLAGLARKQDRFKPGLSDPGLFSPCPCGTRIYLDDLERIESVSPMPAAALVAMAAPINLNKATIADLSEIPGIGPALGKAIVDHRSGIGLYNELEELSMIKGIGGIRKSVISEYVSLGDPPLTRRVSTRQGHSLAP
jgi:hypothetical protein